jgi:hypothetical protein
MGTTDKANIFSLIYATRRVLGSVRDSYRTKRVWRYDSIRSGTPLRGHQATFLCQSFTSLASTRLEGDRERDTYTDHAR